MSYGVVKDPDADLDYGFDWRPGWGRTRLLPARGAWRTGVASRRTTVRWTLRESRRPSGSAAELRRERPCR